MEKAIFQFKSYKAYLGVNLGSRGERRGLKSGLAKALHCQPTYISQVLNGNAHLSLEQADAANSFLGHSKEEARYFLLLVQLERSGTASLRAHFEEQMAEMQKKRMVLTQRLGTKNELSKEDQIHYYSSWHFAAIHIALTIPELQEKQALADFFKLPIKKVNSTLAFLIQTGLAKPRSGGGYTSGDAMIRLGSDSPNIFRHHSNWRMYAMDSLDREEVGDLHYSGVVSLSKKDAIRIKDRLLERLKQDLDLIRASPEEELYGYCLDFFSLLR